jgi:fatty acid-binding protein DegV
LPLRVILRGMKAKDKQPLTPSEVFTKALASVLSASPEQIRESRAQAKAEKAGCPP